MTLLTNQVAHQYITALRNAQTKQVDKHYHIVTIGACSQSLVANLIDEITFNYTTDSYKAPALHVMSLMRELLQTLENIENCNILATNNKKPITLK